MINAAGNARTKTNYETALEAARVRLRDCDIARQVGRVGGVIEDGPDGVRAVRIPCIGATYCVRLSDGGVWRDDGAPVGIFAEILILHALLLHTGRPPGKEWIAFSEIPDGLLYAGVCERRTAQRLARALSGAGDRLVAAAERLGGNRASLGGDVSAIVEPFSGVPVGIVFWESDDEFTPAVTFLYDKTITAIFPAEDVVVLTQWLVEEVTLILKEITR